VRTVVANHELLPQGLELESLSIEPGPLRIVRRNEVALPGLRPRLVAGAQPTATIKSIDPGAIMYRGVLVFLLASGDCMPVQSLLRTL
jgi:hypothetical protein